MIFAAGMGTRLQPLTNNKPKALVEINGRPLLEIAIERLKTFGYNEIIVNVHHYAHQVIDFLRQKKNFNIRIEISDETNLLLDTGGGLKKAGWFFNDNQPFLIHNVDIISEVDLTELYETHINSRSLTTLAVKERKSSRYFLFDDSTQLCGWENVKTGDKIISRYSSPELTQLAFSGIQIVSPAIFNLMKDEGVFSITNTYIELCANHKITGYLHNDSFWMDLGKPESIKKAEGILK